ncbi:GNAT family N-acetyltransferase [Candidatus Woesearchaeota archaeon]|nr:GNAT family N-acetyltransferase [Candidatus Woesearchaeota archaeon]
MDLKQVPLSASGVKISIIDNDLEVARARVYILNNDSHEQPFGFLEDVFVHERYRNQGLGSRIVREAMRVAKEKSCYKLICTSRFENEHVHRLYSKIGFAEHGKEFRINFDES